MLARARKHERGQEPVCGRSDGQLRTILHLRKARDATLGAVLSAGGQHSLSKSSVSQKLSRAKLRAARARRARQSVWRRARGLHAAKCMCSRGQRFHSNAASTCMRRYMTAMANLILPELTPAEKGPRPRHRSPPKTRMESLGTFRSHLELSTFLSSSIAKTM